MQGWGELCPIGGTDASICPSDCPSVSITHRPSVFLMAQPLCFPLRPSVSLISPLPPSSPHCVHAFSVW